MLDRISLFCNNRCPELGAIGLFQFDVAWLFMDKLLSLRIIYTIVALAGIGHFSAVQREVLHRKLDNNINCQNIKRGDFFPPRFVYSSHCSPETGPYACVAGKPVVLIFGGESSSSLLQNFVNKHLDSALRLSLMISPCTKAIDRPEQPREQHGL